ncbi:unnamed protein product [Caenorhabditis bovis]|uniref:CHK kinase-like domain-containing protein n=1 Tax=Caenorhabditis bovis TaxID=2654633 RepID=A0A8S1EF70_9PELO|nr:unnamed protein product [Caenorhabditis bovis]
MLAAMSRSLLILSSYDSCEDEYSSQYAIEIVKKPKFCQRTTAGIFIPKFADNNFGYNSVGVSISTKQLLTKRVRNEYQRIFWKEQEVLKQQKILLAKIEELRLDSGRRDTRKLPDMNYEKTQYYDGKCSPPYSIALSSDDGIGSASDLSEDELIFEEDMRNGVNFHFETRKKKEPLKEFAEQPKEVYKDKTNQYWNRMEMNHIEKRRDVEMSKILDDENKENENVKQRYTKKVEEKAAKKESAPAASQIGYTKESLLKLLQDEYKVKQVEDIELHPFGTDGFCSSIVQVTLTYDDKTTESVIAKFPETGNIKNALEITTETILPDGADQQFVSNLLFFFNREVQFYSMPPVPRLHVPNITLLKECKQGQLTGVILMQDLREYLSVPYHDSLNIHQLTSIGNQLHELHLSSLDMNPDLASQFEFPMGLIDTYASTHEYVKLFADRHAELRPMFKKVEKLYKDRELFIRLLRDAHRDLGAPSVMCHGDLWSYNLLWIPSPDDPSVASNHLAYIIDWQNFHIGNPAEDIGHVLTFCCDPETRRYAEKNYLPIYYQELKIKAAQLKLNFEMTMEQFLSSYRRNYIANSLFCAFIISVMLRVKPAKNKFKQFFNTKKLIRKVIENWSDALDALHEEYPNYPM